MPQLAYNINMARAFAGMKTHAGDDLVESYLALRVIQFGRGLGAVSGDVDIINPATNDNGDLALGGPLVTGNIITLTINGISATVTFATSSTATLAALVTAWDLAAGDDSYVLAITDPEGTPDISIFRQGTLITLSVGITGGTPPSIGAATYTSTNIFRGISLHTHVAEGQYEVNDAVNVLRQGSAWVETSEAVAKDAAAYVDLADGSGKFTDEASGNLATGGTFKSATTVAGLAIVEINLP